MIQQYKIIVGVLPLLHARVDERSIVFSTRLRGIACALVLDDLPCCLRRFRDLLMLPRKSALTAWPIQSSLSGGCCTNSGKYYPSAGLDSWKVRTVSSEESSCTDVGKFCMVSALAREVDRSKHRSVYRGESCRVDAYARPRWWCCSPHQLTPPLFLLVSQFSGPLINKQTSVLHKKPRFINTL